MTEPEFWEILDNQDRFSPESIFTSPSIGGSPEPKIPPWTKKRSISGCSVESGYFSPQKPTEYQRSGYSRTPIALLNPKWAARESLMSMGPFGVDWAIQSGYEYGDQAGSEFFLIGDRIDRDAPPCPPTPTPSPICPPSLSAFHYPSELGRSSPFGDFVTEDLQFGVWDPIPEGFYPESVVKPDVYGFSNPSKPDNAIPFGNYVSEDDPNLGFGDLGLTSKEFQWGSGVNHDAYGFWNPSKLDSDSALGNYATEGEANYEFGYWEPISEGFEPGSAVKHHLSELSNQSESPVASPFGNYVTEANPNLEFGYLERISEVSEPGSSLKHDVDGFSKVSECTEWVPVGLLPLGPVGRYEESEVLWEKELEYLIYKKAKEIAEVVFRQMQKEQRSKYPIYQKPSGPVGMPVKASPGRQVAQEARYSNPPRFRLSNSSRLPRSRSNSEQKPVKNYCEFCMNNARYHTENAGLKFDDTSDGPWRDHRCKNEFGEVVCPVLSKHVCQECGATGKNAHTIRYCTKKKEKVLRQLPVRN